MKYLVSLTLILCGFNFSLFSQNHYSPFAENNVRWSILEYHRNPLYPFNTWLKTVQLKMYGDTIINGIMYNKIYKSYDFAFPASSDSLHCFIRQDTNLRRVYVRYPISLYPDTSDIILYDFNLHLGDTTTLKLIGSGNSYRAKVVSITDSAQLNNNVFRRHFSLYFIDTYSSGWVWGQGCDDIDWNESIGSSNFLLYTEIPENSCSYIYYGLQCYWDNGLFIIGGSNCDYATGIQNDNETEGQIIKIFPNPASDKISVKLMDGIVVEMVKISNLTASNISYKHGLFHNEFKLDVSYLPVGFYYLQLITIDGKLLNTKFSIIR